MLTDGDLISEWRLVRFTLYQALAELSIKEIYLIERVGNVLTICYVIDGADQLRPLTRMRVVDTLIERHAPELYRRYLFLHEVWEEKDWKRQRISKVGYREPVLR